MPAHNPISAAVAITTGSYLQNLPFALLQRVDYLARGPLQIGEVAGRELPDRESRLDPENIDRAVDAPAVGECDGDGGQAVVVGGNSIAPPARLGSRLAPDTHGALSGV
jgi:hypothetical protein